METALVDADDGTELVPRLNHDRPEQTLLLRTEVFCTFTGSTYLLDDPGVELVFAPRAPCP